jgi:hypothetical protein
VAWPFYALLHHILKFGCQTPGPNYNRTWTGSGDTEIRRDDHGFLIRNLSISFSTTATEDELATEGNRRDWFSVRSFWDSTTDNRHTETIVMRPKWFAEYVFSFFQSLLSMSYHMAEYGSRLYQWVGVVTLIAEGEIIGRFDLGEGLPRSPLTTTLVTLRERSGSNTLRNEKLMRCPGGKSMDYHSNCHPLHQISKRPNQILT